MAARCPYQYASAYNTWWHEKQLYSPKPMIAFRSWTYIIIIMQVFPDQNRFSYRGISKYTQETILQTQCLTGNLFLPMDFLDFFYTQIFFTDQGTKLNQSVHKIIANFLHHSYKHKKYRGVLYIIANNIKFQHNYSHYSTALYSKMKL